MLLLVLSVFLPIEMNYKNNWLNLCVCVLSPRFEININRISSSGVKEAIWLLQGICFHRELWNFVNYIVDLHYSMCIICRPTLSLVAGPLKKDQIFLAASLRQPWLHPINVTYFNLSNARDMPRDKRQDKLK